jgi:hypothetical protein
VTDALLAMSVLAIAWFFIDFHFITWSLSH